MSPKRTRTAGLALAVLVVVGVGIAVAKHLRCLDEAALDGAPGPADQ